FFQAEDGIRDRDVTGVQTCALPICGTQRMTHILGRAKALENIFQAKKLTPKEAEAQGLITKAVENLEEETRQFAERLAEGAVFAMGQAKKSINAAELPLEKGLSVEAKAFTNTFKSDEPRDR